MSYEAIAVPQLGASLACNIDHFDQRFLAIDHKTINGRKNGAHQ